MGSHDDASIQDGDVEMRQFLRRTIGESLDGRANLACRCARPRARLFTSRSFLDLALRFLAFGKCAHTEDDFLRSELDKLHGGFEASRWRDIFKVEVMGR